MAARRSAVDELGDGVPPIEPARVVSTPSLTSSSRFGRRCLYLFFLR